MATVASAIRSVHVSAFTIPTDQPESDGTLEWDRTTLVLVEIEAAGRRGLGWTYADTATARVCHDVLADAIQGQDALAIAARWDAMRRRVRNLGARGIAAMAISAVDNALWDLKAKLVGMPLATLLGAARGAVPAYGSGGFTSYTNAELEAQLVGWVARGIQRVKMKVGRQPRRDPERVRVARLAIGPEPELFVDGNGAYTRAEARCLAETFGAWRVTWFEEPVTSDDLDGLAWLRAEVPRGMEVAAGEYGYDPGYFRRMLAAQSVDVLQADATRCLGVSGFLAASALCEAFGVPLSAHCAPQLHAHLGCAVSRVRHVEYFHDHARIERMLFDGAIDPVDGLLRPDASRPGVGVELKRADAKKFEVQP